MKVSARSGHGQGLTFDSIKIILYSSLGGMLMRSQHQNPNIEIICHNKGLDVEMSLNTPPSELYRINLSESKGKSC